MCNSTNVSNSNGTGHNDDDDDDDDDDVALVDGINLCSIVTKFKSFFLTEKITKFFSNRFESKRVLKQKQTFCGSCSTFSAE